MKKLILLLMTLFCCTFALANPITKCTKKYNIDVQKAYIISYSAIKNSKYNVIELQSESGYILFSAGNREFLLEASPMGNDTIIKIVPVDSDMNNLSVQENVFKALDNEVLKVK